MEIVPSYTLLRDMGMEFRPSKLTPDNAPLYFRRHSYCPLDPKDIELIIENFIREAIFKSTLET